MTEYTLGFIFSSDYKHVLLIKRGTHAFHSNKHNGLGGKIHIGESPKECMVREIREESDIKTAEDDWQFAGVLTSSEWKVWVFTTSVEKMEFEKKEIPEGIVEWAETKNLPQSIVSNLQWLVPFCVDKLNYPELTSFVVWYTQNYEGKE